MIILLLSAHSFFNKISEPAKHNRINGFNLVAPSKPFPIDSLTSIKNIGADWVAIVPYAFCNAETAEIIFDHPRQWWGEKPEGVIETIKMAKSQGLKIMLKPHLWVGGQGWAGDLNFETDSLWLKFNDDYKRYLFTYAQIADSLDVEILCIGTEIRNSSLNHNNFWTSLIDSLKLQYQGKLTYAANWDEYDKIQFWNQLDYIGIDAYFPLSDEKSPSKIELLNAWKTPKKEMKKIHLKYDNPILFTEFGYESVEYNTMGHWKLSKDTLQVNYPNQSLAFEALFESLKEEKWWSGGFIWKWHLNRKGKHRRTIKAYTPQDKPALELIKEEYKHYF